MAYGDVAVNSSQESSATTTHTCSLPTIANNDLATVRFSIPSGSDIATTPTGWTRRAYLQDGSRGLYLFERRCNGGEGSTLEITTSSSVTSTHLSIAIEAAKHYATSSGGTGSSTSMGDNTLVFDTGSFVLVGYGCWDSTATVTTWPTNFTQGRTQVAQSGNNGSISATGLAANTGLLTNHSLSASSNWLFHALAYDEDTTDPPDPPGATIASSTTASGEVIGVGVDGIKGQTTCSGALTASEIRSAILATTTLASGKAYGAGLTPVDPQPIAGITLAGVTTAGGTVTQDEAAEQTTISGTAAAFGDMSASPVSSAVLMSMTTGAFGSMTGPGPIISATIGATTSAEGETVDSPPSFASGNGLNCCCTTLDPPDCSVQIYFGDLERVYADTESEPQDDFGLSLTRARLPIGVSATDGATYRIEILLGGVVQVDTEQALGTYSTSLIVEENRTIEVHVTGITSECESSRSCEFYGYPPTDCFKGFFSSSAAGQCFDGWRAEWEYRVAPPTHSVEVSGLVGPMSALNGIYSVNECEPIASAGLCWKGINWPTVNFGLNLAWVRVRMTGAGAEAEVRSIHDWSQLRSLIDSGLRFDCCEALTGVPNLVQLGPAAGDLYFCDSKIESIRANGGSWSRIAENIASISYATRTTSCESIAYQDPCNNIGGPFAASGRVYLGFAVISSGSSGNCTYDDGFGTVRVAEACASSGVLTWLS